MTDFSAVDQAFSTPTATGGSFDDIDKAFANPTPFPSQNKIAPADANPKGVLSNAPGNSDSVASSTAKSVGTMGVEGVSGALGMVGSLRDLSRELGDRAVSYVTGRPLDEVRARGDRALQEAYSSPWQIPSPHLSSFPNAADVAGKITPYTGAYEPTTEAGRLAQAGGSALVAGALMAPEAGLLNAASNVVGGVAGQATSDAGYNPLVSSLVGMGAAAGTGALGSSSIAPSVSPKARLAKVGQTLTENMSDPEATTKAILNPPDQNIPNEALTTYQTTASAGAPDAGLGQLEREVSRAAPAAFIDKTNAASKAQLAAKAAIQSNGSPEDVGNFVTAQSRDLDDRWEAAQQAAAAKAQGATAPLGGEQPLSVYGQRIANELMPEYEATRGPAVDQVDALGGTQDPSAVGAAMRTPALAAQETLTQRKRALYNAVDPDGTLNVVASPLRAAHDDIYGNMSSYSAPPEGAEVAIRDSMQNAPDVLPFRDLQALDARASDAMSAERRLNGESPAWRRLAQQKHAIMNTINDGVANQVAYERAQTAAGAAASEDTIEGRLQAWQDELNVQQQQAGVANGPGNVGAVAGGQAAPDARVLGTEGQTNGGSGNTSGNPGSQTPVGGKELGAGAAVSRPQSMLGFLKSIGGLRDDPELTARDMRASVPGLMNNKRGMSLDKAREAAAEAGYLGEPPDRAMAETDVSDFLDALDDHPHYRARDAGQLAQLEDQRAGKSYRDRLKAEATAIGEFSRGSGLGSVDRELGTRAAELYLEDQSIGYDGALERAAIALHNENIDNSMRHGTVSATEDRFDEQPQADAEIRGAGATAGHAGNRRGNQRTDAFGRQAVPNAGQTGAAPNFDQAAIARLAAAKAAHVDLSQLKQSSVGAITKSSGFGGQFKMSDASVPGAMIQKGDKGFQVASAYRKYAGDDPTTVPTIRNYLAYKLRQGYLNPDGTLNATKYPTFRKDYDGVFRAFPELAPEFDKAASATDALKKFGKFNPQYAPTSVPDLFFAPGDAGAAGVQQLRSLIGKHKADPLLADVATNLMRAHAERNGVVTPAGLEAFDRKYGPAMAQFPALRQKFADAGKATQAIGETAIARKRAVEDFQKGAVGRLIGVGDPTTVQRVVGSIFGRVDAVPVMGRLASLAAKDGSGVATEGLRQAVADHIAQQFTTPGGFKPGTFQSFMRKQDPVLRQVFSKDQMDSWAPLIKSIEATNASNVGTKIGVGSDTAQNMIAHLKAAAEKGHKEPMFESLWKSALVSREVFEPLLHHVGLGSLAMPLAMTASVGNKVLSAIRNAGISKTSDLLKEALLNPEIAKSALMTASKKADRGSELSLAMQLRRLSMLGPQTYGGQQDNNRPTAIPARADGGRVESSALAVNDNPTEAQKAVGNYKKSHIRIHGLDVTIENLRGSERGGVHDGKAWSVKMPHHYGYIRGHIGADDDHVDCYVGPHESSDKVFVVDQKNLKTGEFDEHKVMFGFTSKGAAMSGYCAGFSDGRGHRRIMKMTPMGIDEFKEWLASGQTREPLKKSA